MIHSCRYHADTRLAPSFQHNHATMSSGTSPTASHVYDCIVVGAGLSGLSAAHYLCSHSLADVLVLEARDRVGGRTHTVTLPNGHWLDLGGAYVGPTQHRVLRLAHSLSIPTEAVYHAGQSVLCLRDRRLPYSGAVPSLGLLALLDVNAALVATEELRSAIDGQRPWVQSTDAGERSLDAMTMEEWICRACDTEDGRELYRGSVRGLLCVEPCEVSALYWMSYVQGGHGVDSLIGVEGGAQERHFRGGSQQLSERLRDAMGVNRVVTAAPVASIDWDEERTATTRTEAEDINAGVDTTALAASARVVVTCRDGSLYYARRVVVAVSPALYGTVRWQPYMPLVKAPFSRAFMGSIIKTVTRYAAPFWRRRGFSGILFSLPSTPTSPSSLPPPVGYSYDDCHEDAAQDGSSFYAVMGFIYGNAARLYSPLPAQQRQAAVTAQYRDAFECDDALHPLSYHEMDWTQEEFSKGCYGAVMPPGVLTQLGPAMRAPVAGVHFAGSELAVDWPGYMSGAVESGERAAHEVLKALGRVDGEFVVEEPRGEGWDVSEGIAVDPFEAAVKRALPSVATVQYALAGMTAAAFAFLAWRLRGG